MKTYNIHVVIEREKNGHHDSSMVRRRIRANTKREAFELFLEGLIGNRDQIASEYDEMPFRPNARLQPEELLSKQTASCQTT